MIKMDDFRFDEKEHAYYSGERRLPSVTDIVANVCGSPGYANEWFLNRGSQIHKAIALYLRRQLDEKSVDDRIRDRVESGKKAIRELGLTSPPFIIEQHMSHKLYRFGGTPDFYANGTLVDWKSSHMKETEIQGGGYILLFEQEKHPPFPVRRFLEVVLGDDGYKVFEYKPSRSKGLFLAAKTIYDWRQKNG